MANHCPKNPTHETEWDITVSSYDDYSMEVDLRCRGCNTWYGSTIEGVQAILDSLPRESILPILKEN